MIGADSLERIGDAYVDQVAYNKAVKDTTLRAKEIIDRMQANMSTRSVTLFAWFLHKVWRAMYNQI